MEKELIDQKQLVLEENEIDLIYLLKTIYKNRKLIIGIAVAVTILGIAFAMLQKKTYTSETTFVEQKSSSSSSMLSSFTSEITFVEQKSSSNSSMLSPLAPSIPFGLGGSLSGGESSFLVTVLESRKFRTEIAEKLKLREYIIEISKMKPEAQKDLTIIDVSEWVKGVVTVNQDTKTGVYKISVELEDKEMAAKIANEYFTILDNYIKNTKLDKNKINREYLEKQLESVEKDLEYKQGLLKGFEKKYNTASIEADSKIALESAAMIKGEIIKTESQLIVARGVYGEESVEVVKLRDTLSEYNKQLNNLQNGTGSVKFVPEKDIGIIKYDLEKLKTEITASTEVYKMLRVQLEQAKLDEISNKSVIELLDEAIVAKVPSATSRKLIVIISGVLGLFMGIFIAFVKEFAKGINWQEFKN